MHKTKKSGKKAVMIDGFNTQMEVTTISFS